MLSTLPPFIIFYIGALLVAVSRGWVRSLFLLATPVVAAVVLFDLEAGTQSEALLQLQLFDYTLTPYRLDKLSLLFGYLFVLVALIGNIFAVHIKETSQLVVGLIYSGSALGAVFAGDLLTLFLFWEMLAVNSVFLIWARSTDMALASGVRYLIIQVLSGVLLLSGALMMVNETGGLDFTAIQLEGLSSWLIFLAFGIKCAFPLLHNWLTDAYPQATPTGAVFLSAFSTKVAVYALARAFAGTDLLIEIGAVMILFPILYAILENDLRRVLAYLMITQVGIMVIGIGIGTPLAINGAVAHVFIHVIYKSLLFMTLGAVLYSTGRSKASELGGLYRALPQTAALCVFGVVFLLFSGFISKALVMQAAMETGRTTVWLLLLASSAGVFHAGLKVPFYAFFNNDAGLSAKALPKNMHWAMYCSVGVCLALAIFPGALYQLLPYPLDYWPYGLTHVLTHIELVCFATLAFIVLHRMKIYPISEASVLLDAEWLYRKPLKQLVIGIRKLAATGYDGFLATVEVFAQRPSQWLLGLFSINGPIERMPPSSMTITIILGIFIVVLITLLLP